MNCGALVSLKVDDKNRLGALEAFCAMVERHLRDCPYCNDPAADWNAPAWELSRVRYK
jgi:hypothetical protein